MVKANKKDEGFFEVYEKNVHYGMKLFILTLPFWVVFFGISIASVKIINNKYDVSAVLASIFVGAIIMAVIANVLLIGKMKSFYNKIKLQ